MEIANVVNYTYIILIEILLVVLILINLNFKLELFQSKETGINRIDGIVYINLDSREDRITNMKELFKSIEVYNKKIYRIAAVPIPQNGHKGCAQSHILALELAKLNNWETTIIFEDDAKLNCSPEELNNKLEEVLTTSIDYDVIVLSAANKKLHPDESKNTTILKRLYSCSTTTCYVIKKHYITKLQNLFKDSNKKMTYEKWGESDGWEPNAIDQRWSELSKVDNWYGLETDLVKQSGTWSNINKRK